MNQTTTAHIGVIYSLATFFTTESVELVNFATEDQLVSDVFYSQHQRSVRPRSTSVMAPSLSATSKYRYIQSQNFKFNIFKKISSLHLLIYLGIYFFAVLF